MKKHNHKESKKAWKEAGFLEEFGAYGKPVNFHGYCQATGAHLITGVCSCGAKRYTCVKRNGPTKWVPSLSADSSN